MSKTFEHFPSPPMTILFFAEIAKLEFLFKQKCSKVFDATQHRRKNQNGHQGERGNAQKFSTYPIVVDLKPTVVPIEDGQKFSRVHR